MKYLLKSKAVIFVFAVAVILVAASAVLSATGRASLIKNAAATVITPIQNGFAYCVRAIDGFAERFTAYDELKSENESLKARLAEQEEELYAAKKLIAENEYLKEYLELKDTQSHLELAQASVIGRESGNYMTVFTLNKGSLHGIKPNMPVIDGTNAVGYITEVGVNWSKAVTLIETASSVGCYVERTGDLGVCEGDFSYKKEGVCRLTYLPYDADIQQGDRILTSGLGDIYPDGLVIGYVKEILPDETRREIHALIETAADLSELREVMIITGREKDA